MWYLLYWFSGRLQDSTASGSLNGIPPPHKTAQTVAGRPVRLYQCAIRETRKQTGAIRKKYCGSNNNARQCADLREFVNDERIQRFEYGTLM